MTDDLAAMAAFAEARLAEGEVRANGLFFACRIPGKLPDFSACGGPAAAAYWQHFTPDRLLAEIQSTRRLLAEIQRMPHLYLDEDAFYSCALAVDPEPYGYDDTGPGSGCLDDTRRGKSCDCGRDPRARRLLAAIVMRWASHPDYLSGWAPAAVGG